MVKKYRNVRKGVKSLKKKTVGAYLDNLVWF